VRVYVQGDRHVGMSECLLNHLGVGADRQHQGGTGVPEVVEAEVGKGRKPRPFLFLPLFTNIGERLSEKSSTAVERGSGTTNTGHSVQLARSRDHH
jgi:hypothetical protein